MSQWVLSFPYPLRFRWVKGPASAELTALANTIARRVDRHLEHRGLIERDAETAFLSFVGVDENPIHQLRDASITDRISAGPQRGRKVFILPTLLTCEPEDRLSGTQGEVAGFSLHAGAATNGKERGKVERLCRDVAHTPVPTHRLSLTPGDKVRYRLKTLDRDGTTHDILTPLDFIAKLTALVPEPEST